MRAIFSSDEELRRRASDTARRVTESNRELLTPYADEIIGFLGASGADNWRTRAHLGLVAARVAHTHAQRLRAAPILRALVSDPSNVVRCSGVEGVAELAIAEPSLRGEAEEIMHRAAISGTQAMRCRAKNSGLLARED